MMPGGFNIDLVLSWVPELWQGAIATILLSGSALIFAFIFGLISCLFRISRSKILNYISVGYIYAIRGTPALIQILIIYFGLPFFQIYLHPYIAGIIALGLNSGAYISEMIRGGLLSIPRGQMEAARSLGMSYGQAMRRVIIPQTFQVIIPPITGEYNKLVKGSSLLSVISIEELTRVGQRIVGSTFRPVEAWLPVALIYFLINYIISNLSKSLEKRLTIRGYEQAD